MGGMGDKVVDTQVLGFSRVGLLPNPRRLGWDTGYLDRCPKIGINPESRETSMS